MRRKFAIVFLAAGLSAAAVFAQWNTGLTGRGGSANVAFVSKLLSGDVSVSTTTATTIDSVTLPALLPACGTNGCRLRVTYDYYGDGGVLGVCYVSDGSSTFGQSQALTANNHTPCGASALSPDTFSSGATPTVTVTIYDSGSTEICQYQSATFTDATCQSSGIQGYLQIETVQSN